ncbi:MAG: hypothetical protein ACKV2T_38235 [Kofleriaceae bacterium]
MRRLLFSLLLVGCGTDGGSTTEELIDGFDPPNPASDEVQILAPPIYDIAPGADITMCSYIDKRLVEETDIVDYQAFQSVVGAHHAILYSVSQQEEANTHECTEDDMVNSRFLAGGGADTPRADPPEGVVFRMPANTQLMIQTHWINATDEAFDGQAAFNLRVTKPKAEHMVAQLFAIGNTSFVLPTGLGSTEADCTIQEHMNVFSLGGHMHEWGKHAKISLTKVGADEAVLWDYPWSEEFQFNPPRNSYTTENPLVLAVGDKMHIECDFDNDTGGPLPFPREMCIGYAYAYPMTKQINCLDGFWPN